MNQHTKFLAVHHMFFFFRNIVRNVVDNIHAEISCSFPKNLDDAHSKNVATYRKKSDPRGRTKLRVSTFSKAFLTPIAMRDLHTNSK